MHFQVWFNEAQNGEDRKRIDDEKIECTTPQYNGHCARHLWILIFFHLFLFVFFMQLLEDILILKLLFKMNHKTYGIAFHITHQTLLLKLLQ